MGERRLADTNAAAYSHSNNKVCYALSRGDFMRTLTVAAMFALLLNSTFANTQTFADLAQDGSPTRHQKLVEAA